MIVSNLPQGISFSFMPLSTTELCWKKIIQGAIVVPMLAMTKKSSSGVTLPPGMCGMSPLPMTWETSGWTMNASGM